MKAVIYHADSHFAWGGKPRKGLYEGLFLGAKKDFARFGIKTIHLTLPGFPQWGDENIVYDGLEPQNVVANREETFLRFLRDSAVDGEEYWFTEPDCRIHKMFEGIKGVFDAAFLYRHGDDVAMCPAWRLATRKALPIFEDFVEAMRMDPRKDWHGDSDAITKVWRLMGSPKEETVYKGIKVQMRKYSEYIKGGGPKFTTNALGPSGKR